MLKPALYAAIAVMAGNLCHAQYTFDFENPPYVSGLIASQDTWASPLTNTYVWTSSEIEAALTASGLNPAGPVHGGSQAFLISGPGGGTTTTRLVPNIPNYSKVTVELWARPLTPRVDISATNLGNIFMTLNNAAGTRAVAFRFGFDAATTNAHIDYAINTSGIWNPSGVAWQADTWYKITMTVDYASQTYDFAVNDVKANTSPIPFYQGNNVNGLGQILFFRGTSQAGMIVDDITITSIAAAEPVARVASSNPFGFKVRIADVDTLTPNTNTITLSFDGQATVPTSLVQSGNPGSGDGTGLTTIILDSATPIMQSGSQHSVTVHFEGTGFAPVNRTIPFTVPQVIGTLDRTHHYLGQFRGTGVKFSLPGGGRTAQADDFAIDMGNPPANNAKVLSDDAEMLTSLRSAVQNDVLSVSLWVKRRSLASSSIFWINSPTAPVSGRAFQLHCPYSDNTVYFDTGGGTVPTSRISTNLTSYLGGIEYWSNIWRHVVAIKNGGAKQVWIDGQLIVEQETGAADISGYNDLNWLIMGAASPDSLVMNGLVDDVSTYSTALSSADITALFNGTAPTAVPSGSSLLAWWDFNDAPALVATRDGEKVIINFSQVLQSSASASGPYVDVPNATSPYTNDVAPGSMMFYRTRK